MKLIGLPDIHGDTEKIVKLASQLSEVDLVLLVGDITNFGHQTEMKEMIEKVQRYNPNCITVPGNCDYQDTEQIMDLMDTNLNGKWRDIDGKMFIGLGASLPTPFGGTPFEVSESYFQQQLTAATTGIPFENPMVLVTHQPPYNTKADALPNGLHVGSKTVRDFIEHHQPLLCVTGHIHEGKGIDAIGNTRIVNPGPVFQGHYAYAELNDTVETLEIRPII